MKTVNTEPQSEVAEIKTAMLALCAEIHSRAECSFIMSSKGQPSFLLYPNRVLGEGRAEMIHQSHHDWRKALQAVHEECERRASTHAENTTQAMAEAIMRITFQFGECSDAQLRGAAFDAVDVVKFGQAAVERANSIADKGPFVLTITASANAEAA